MFCHENWLDRIEGICFSHDHNAKVTYRTRRGQSIRLLVFTISQLLFDKLFNKLCHFAIIASEKLWC